MKCKNKHVYVDGFEMDVLGRFGKKTFTCTITNDERGKTFSITNGTSQFTIPFEPIERYLK